MKRLIDILFSIIGLILFSPIIIFTIFLIWFYDFGNPFYMPMRMGMNMIPFKMYKFRTMIVNADKNGVSSTSGNDKRITPIGRIIRRFKLDEISQLINVLFGDMSLVGPRPQVCEHVLNEYNDAEKRLLDIRPGITDISSIVFSDEGEILKNSINPDKDYNLLIRPWKSRLGLIYANNHSILLDFVLIILTIIAIVNKKTALKFINRILIYQKVDIETIQVCLREKKLTTIEYPK